MEEVRWETYTVYYGVQRGKKAIIISPLLLSNPLIDTGAVAIDHR